VTALEHNPNMEAALEFASDHLGEAGRSEIRSCLAQSILSGRPVRLGRVFSDCGWGELARPADLLERAVEERDRNRRAAILDRVIDAVLSSVRERISDFSESIKLPSLTVFGLGVLVPLVLVLLLPTISLLGGGLALAQLALIYCVLLPAAVFIVTERMTGKRPDFIGPPAVRVGRPSPVVLIPFTAAATILIVPGGGETAILVSLWLSVLGVSLALLTVGFRPFRLRMEIDRIEEEFPDFMLEVGNRLSDGEPLERAIVEYGRDRETPLGRIAREIAAEVSGGCGLKSPVDRVCQKSMTVASGIRLLLASAERGGESAGRTVVRISEHLRKIFELRREMRRAFADLLSTMRALAVLFSPVLMAFTARMYEVIHGRGILLSTFSHVHLTAVMAVYTVILAALLVDYGVRLEHGKDAPVRCVNVAVAMPTALAVFTISWLAGGAVFSILIG
jgi:hypothetical protein